MNYTYFGRFQSQNNFILIQLCSLAPHTHADTFITNNEHETSNALTLSNSFTLSIFPQSAYEKTKWVSHFIAKIPKFKTRFFQGSIGRPLAMRTLIRSIKYSRLILLNLEASLRALSTSFLQASVKYCITGLGKQWMSKGQLPNASHEVSNWVG